MIEWDNNARISNIVISTALGFGDGLPLVRLRKDYQDFMDYLSRTDVNIFTKSFTLEPLKGNFNPYNPFTWKYVKKTNDMSIINNYKLGNPGADSVVHTIDQQKIKGFNLIPNIWSPDYEGFLHPIAKYLADERIIELNFSCPNKLCATDPILIVKALKQEFPKIKLIAKIGINFPLEWIKIMEDVGIDAWHTSNSIPIKELKFCDSSEYAKLKGEGWGLSGFRAYALAFPFNEKIKKLATKPVIMGCGVTSYKTARGYFNIGADCVSICALAVINPEITTEIIKELN